MVDDKNKDKDNVGSRPNYFVRHSLTYGLLAIFCLVIFYLQSITGESKKIFVAGAMAGNGEFKYDTLVLIDDNNVLAIGGGCGTQKAEMYNIPNNTFKEISSPNFCHSTLRNVLNLNDDTILIVSTDGTEIYNNKIKKFIKIENSIFNKIISQSDIINSDFYNVKLLKISNRFILCIKNYKNIKDNSPKKAILYILDYNNNKILNYYEFNNLNFDINFFDSISDKEFIVKTTKEKYFSFVMKKNNFKYDLLNEIPNDIEEKNKTYQLIQKITSELIPQRKGYVHEPIILKNGNILFLSEKDNYLFDKQTSKLEKINKFEYLRRNFSTIEMPNGDVLIVGGSCGNTESHYPFNEFEIFHDK